MWLIALGVVLFIVAISIAPKKQEAKVVARPKESEPVVPDICDELNELESKILKYVDGSSVRDYEPNQRIFARQSQIINGYYREGIDIDMDIATQRWKVR